MKGQLLLSEINVIRAALGKGSIEMIRIDPDVLHAGENAIATAAGCGIGFGEEDAERQRTDWPERITLKFHDPDTTRAVAAALEQPYNARNHEVLATDAINSLILAAHFGLVFIDADSYIRGWIEPTDNDPAIWDLFLMRGYPYPPGHEPRSRL